MKFIHTADWHLGRYLHGTYLLEDQEFILGQILEKIKKFQPDFLFVSGDIYDRSIPPSGAVKVLNDFLSEVVLNLRTKVIIIAGNHDGPDRLCFGNDILREKGLYLYGKLSPRLEAIQFDDEFGPVDIFPIPYFELPDLRSALLDPNIESFGEGVKKLISKIKEQAREEARLVVLLHAFLLGGKESESERPLSVGGSEFLNSYLFKDLDYVALGHLHRSQQSTYPHIVYPGSILKYSGSEVSHKKSVILGELKEPTNLKTIESLLHPRRDLRRVIGTMKELLLKGKEDPNSEDYLIAKVMDQGPLINAMERLREVYPNILHLERPQIQLATEELTTIKEGHEIEDSELFKTFYEQVHKDGRSFSEKLQITFKGLLKEIEESERRY